MKPMTHAEATSIMAKREALLADDNVEIWVGFDSDGPIILIMATEQGNVLEWLL